MASPSLRARKAPRQQRSAATVVVLLDAAERVLDRDGLPGFNTNRIAEVAGVSVGSLYQYFPNKEALAAALIGRAQQRFAAALEQRVAEVAALPLADGVAALARFAIDGQYARPRLAAALDHEERRLPIGRELRAHEQRIGTAIDTFLDAHRAEVDPALPRAAALDCLVITRAIVEAEVDRGAAPADLQERVVRALLGYLRPASTRQVSR